MPENYTKCKYKERTVDKYKENTLRAGIYNNL